MSIVVGLLVAACTTQWYYCAMRDICIDPGVQSHHHGMLPRF